MTTSDSEDFESADEDIELESPALKSSVQVKCELTDAKSSIRNDCSSDDISSSVTTKSALGHIAMGNETSPLSGNHVLEEVMDVKCVIKDDSKSKVERFSDDFSKNKSVVPPVSIPTVQDPLKPKLERRPERGKPQGTRESRSGPMKLGIKLSSKAPSSENNKPSETLGEFYLLPDMLNIEENRHSEAASSPPVELRPSTIMSTDNPAETDMEQPQQQSSGWGFGKGLMGTGGLGSLGGWGSSLLNTATLSVSTLGSHVSQGINTVLETVEAGIGAPNPEELARKIKEEKEKANESEELGEKLSDQTREGDDAGELEMEAWGDWNDDDRGGAGDDAQGGGTGLLSLVSGVTQVTGKVFSTGLDTLEVIGKKTMEVLQEGDPGLKKKRALLLGERDTVVLSQVLREAKEKAEAEAKLAEEKEAARKAHFETLFDDFQGLVHLEALEMLSRQSDLRLKSLLLKESGPALRGLQLRLAAVQEMCEVPDLDESEDVPALSEMILQALNVLSVEVSADKLIQCVKESHYHLADMKADVGDNGMSKALPKIIHQEAITALATLTANAIEVFHKVTELLLVKEGKSRDVKEESKALVGITSSLISEVNKIATEFSDFLSTKLNDDSLPIADKEKVESYITSTFLEASNSSTYIQDAFQLMVPMLQMGAIA